MEQFLSLILSFPTVPLTVAMGIVLLYWLFVIVGVAGHDLLDGVAGAHGADAAEGAVAGAKAAGGDGDVDGGGLFSALGLGKTPVTITFSCITFFAWLGTIALRGVTPQNLLGGSAVLVGCLFLSLFVTALALKPFARVFEPAPVASRRDVIGHICTITSTKVNATFGTATVSDGGPGLLLNVVCAKDNKLTDGDRAVIVQWDERAQAFDVEPVDWLLPHEVEALKDPSAARSVIASRVKAR